MNLFRSEEHVRRWLGTRPGGASISVTRLSRLAHVWWADRLDPRWTPHTRRHNEELLRRVGLTQSFWRLS